MKLTLSSLEKSQTEKKIQTWLILYCSKLLLVKSQEINIQLPLEDHGLDSSEILSLTSDLEDWLGQEISPKLVYQYPTIEKLAQHLAKEVDR